MQSVLEFDRTLSKTQHRSRPIKACQSCRTRRVRKSVSLCIALASYVDRLNAIAYGQNVQSAESASRHAFIKRTVLVRCPQSPRSLCPETLIGSVINLWSPNLSSGVPLKIQKFLTTPANLWETLCPCWWMLIMYVRCSFGGLSTETTEDSQTTKADIELICQFDRQMSRLNLGDVAPEDLLPILASLPAYEYCIRLYEFFEACVHPVVPICHIPSLKQTLTGFWADYSFTTSVDTVALILSVIYAALVSSPDKRGVEVAVPVYKSYDSLLRKMDFPNETSKVTVPLLQSYLLVHTCKASQIEPLRSFGFLPPAVRVAQSLKLHMERKSNSEIEAEVRRRIWWHLIYLDIEATLVSGLPILIHEDDYSTQMPCQLDDDSIMEKPGMLSHHSRASSPMMISMQGRWHWAFRTRIWRRQKPTTDELGQFKQQIMRLSHELEQAGEDLWARSYLQLQCDRVIVSAARGFMNGKSIGNVDCEHQVLRCV